MSSEVTVTQEELSAVLKYTLNDLKKDVSDRFDTRSNYERLDEYQIDDIATEIFEELVERGAK